MPIRFTRSAPILVLLSLVVITSCGSQTASTDDTFRIAMILSGPINDGGWNAAHYQGLQNVESEGAEVAYTENAERPDFESIMRNYGNDGYDLVIGNGAEYSDTMMEIGPEFPDTQFIAVFGYAEGDNVGSYVPKGNEIGYLQGVVAGQLTESGTVGWVGGIQIPSLDEMLAGLRDGVEAVNADAEVITTYTGNFIDVGAGREAGLALSSQGADVLLAVANGGNVGVTQAAEETGSKFVGWPLEMRDLAPEAVAVSVVFDIPGVVERIVTEVQDGTFEGNIVRIGVADGVLSYGEFSEWVPEDVVAEAEATLEGIRDGSLEIPEHLDVYGN